MDVGQDKGGLCWRLLLGQIRYEFTLGSPDDARTSICHCRNCKKFTGGESGVTIKIPKNAFRITQGKTTEHIMDDGSGTNLHREFCGTCGGPILEYGDPAADKQRYFWGTLDEPDALPPKGEFFCKDRAGWMPEIKGKQKIKD
ncbi:hypothetical protein CALVIDRAFT_551645 [Calocera viscosa TUFC12733]|uniref:CENP-V/GFA domain-containing protein n=1 Tax=Calocera viscosa (strain TUFC12733) TaxID=1330018 RepID=A0A167G916_CALVF|nr:hypothetical protein CALVIDRAFT_551645 [Calocera viscosa TUFC12733]